MVNRSALASLTLLIISLPTVALADAPTAFTPGEAISASAVNDNFTNLDERVLEREAAVAIDEEGRVGVGTAVPESPFHLSADTAGEAEYTARIIDSNSSIGANLVLGWTGAPEDEKYKSIYVDSNGLNMGWLTDSLSGSPNPRVTIANTGMVGIGTRTPDASLDIQYGGGSAPKLRLGTSGTGARDFRFVISGPTANYDTLFIEGEDAPGSNSYGRHLSIHADGNVGIGTTNPGYKLDVNGTVRAVDFIPDSDRRLKTHIQDIPDPLGTLMQLDGVAFEWRDASRPQGLQYGVIAQDVEAVLPELVHEGSNGFKGVNYDAFTAFLIEATKEQQLLIESQSNTIKNQAQQIADLEQRLTAIEAMLSKPNE